MSDDRDRRGMSPFAAGFLGAIIGAIGTAVAIVLSKPENREKLRNKAEELRAKGEKTWEELKQKSGEIENKIRKETEKRGEDVK